MRKSAVVSALAAMGIAGFLQAGHALVVIEQMPHPDAIVSLGSHEWERLPRTARLARDNPHAVVFLTRPVHVTPHNCHRCEERVDWLVAAGVPRERVVLLPQRARNTHDEATAALAYVQAHRLRSLTIVTSPYHGRRALATFRAVAGGTPVRIGLEPALRESGAAPWWWWTRPVDRWYVAYECTAILWYALRFGVNPFLA